MSYFKTGVLSCGMGDVCFTVFSKYIPFIMEGVLFKVKTLVIF